MPMYFPILVIGLNYTGQRVKQTTSGHKKSKSLKNSK